VFNGKILVRQDAQKTNAKQTNRNLLLSDEAVVHTKPQLEIFADDVKCTHGATVGQMDEEAVFYLRSRGIGLEHARRILVRAFASDVVERIPLETVRARLNLMLTERFKDKP
jgi:Fe-S cluster assembly protein SufD